MKVLLISLHLVEYAVELASALGKTNQVHLVLSKHRVCQTVNEQLREKIAGNVSYTLLPKPFLHSPSILKTIYSIFKIHMTFRCDVIHLQECGNPLNLFFVIFRFIPVVATVHDVTLHPGEAVSSARSWRLWVGSMMRRYAYDKVIVHGRKLKKDFLNRHKRSACDVGVVPHGCLFSFLPDRSVETPEESHTVLFFGRIEKYKGLKYLLEAEPLVSKVIPDFKIIVAGKGDDLRTYKSVLATNPHFEIHDRFISNEEVHLFFQRASVVVLPYIEASQSGVAAMAFAFGKPVIVSNVGSLGEMVINGKTGLVVSARDSIQLAETILFLLQNEGRRRKMGKWALQAANSGLGWDHIAGLTEGVYQAATKSN